jgi:hypothetical protein
MAKGTFELFIGVEGSGHSEDPQEDGFMPAAKYRADRRVDDYIKSLPSCATGWGRIE